MGEFAIKFHSRYVCCSVSAISAVLRSGHNRQQRKIAALLDDMLNEQQDAASDKIKWLDIIKVMVFAHLQL